MDLDLPRQLGHEAGGVPLQSQINLVIQIVILSLIVIGLVAWRRGKLDQHGKLMGVATVLGIGSILFVMIPVFTSSLGDFLNDLPSGSLRAQINILHGVIGIVGVSLAGVVTGRWASGKFRVGKSCYSKNLMRATVAVWVFALVLGIGVYLAHVLAWM